MLVDHHCHLDHPAFDQDRDHVVARARAAGVTHCKLAATTRQHWPRLLTITQQYGFTCSLGLHPYYLDQHCLTGEDNDLVALACALEQRRTCVTAVGECGIDGRFNDTLPTQWALFEAQLDLAKQFELPVIIHCVHLYDQLAKCLRRYNLPKGGLVHAFTGSLQQAQHLIDLGYSLGIGGAVTYPRNKKVQRMVASLPEGSWVLESDAPDMPPYVETPPDAARQHAGRLRNEPGYIAKTAGTVASLRSARTKMHT